MLNLSLGAGLALFYIQATIGHAPDLAVRANEIAIVEPERPTRVERTYSASCGRNRLSVSIRTWEQGVHRQIKSITVNGRAVSDLEIRTLGAHLPETARLYEADVGECVSSQKAFAKVRLYYLPDPTKADGARSRDFMITVDGKIMVDHDGVS